MKPTTISKIFVLAGLSNIVGVLLFSKLFTNQVMMETQPDVMGYFGLFSIMLWGFAYIAINKKYASVPWLIAVFLLEKIIYVVVYLGWLTTHSLSDVYDQDVLAGIFYTVYGANDFLFGLFFAYVFFKVLKKA